VGSEGEGIGPAGWFLATGIVLLAIGGLLFLNHNIRDNTSARGSIVGSVSILVAAGVCLVLAACFFIRDYRRYQAEFGKRRPR
jgi:hypothetical protein